MIGYLKEKLPRSFVIAGNVGTPEAVIDLENWGADATKVGVGPGKVCITKLKTGFGTGGWQLSALKWCARVATKPIIADGGIRDHGDIAKSVRFGAAVVMIGSLFAGHEEPPGQPVEVAGKLLKEHYGIASDFHKGEDKHDARKRILAPIKARRAGPLHMGHAFNQTIRDSLRRYRRMRSFNTMWVPGTDHAGIATQIVVERQLQDEGLSRHDLGRDKFAAKVWEWKVESGTTITRQM